MNDTTTLVNLTMRTLSGEEGAKHQLLTEAYTPVSFQCRMILHDTAEAQTIIDEIMEMLSNELESLDNPANFSRWMQKLIASKCSHALGYQRWYGDTVEPSEEAAEEVPLPGKFLDETQTAFYIASAIERLPDDERLCAVLRGCGGMSVKDISRHTQFSEEVVRKQLDMARIAVKSCVRRRQDEGITFIALGSMSIMLYAAMEYSRDRSLAAIETEKYLTSSIPASEQEEVPKQNPKQEQKSGKKRRKKKVNWFGRIFLTLVVLCALAAMVLFGAIVFQELGSI